MLLEKVTLHDKIGHLFRVDIEFDYENAHAKQIMYNEIYPPVIDKHKKQTLTTDQCLNFVSYTLKQRKNQNRTE